MNKRTCTLPNCNKPHEAKGLCDKHYQQHRAAQKPPKHTRKCEFCGIQFGTNYSLANCCGAKECKRNRANRYARARTFERDCIICGRQYRARQKNGQYCQACRGEARVISRNPENLAIYKATRDGNSQGILDAIAGRCIITDSGCWEWQGPRSASGYGHVSTRRNGRTSEAVHRVVFEHATGIKPSGMTVHHKCANAPCCNPDHLQLATHRENLAEMQARRTYEAQIDELRKALALHEPDHPLLKA